MATCRQGATGVRQARPKTSSYDGIKVSQEFLHHFVLTDFGHNLTAMSLVASEGMGLSYGLL